jgi:hypothetical protein
MMNFYRRPSPLKPLLMVVMASAFVLVTTPALAQSSPPDVDSDLVQLSNKVKVGESIVITTDTGAEVRGRFLSSSATGIALHVNDMPEQLSASQIYRVQIRRNGVLLGGLIGAGVGIPFGFALKSYAHNEGGNEAGALAFPIMVGLGTGVLIDAFLVRPRTVFERAFSTRSRLAPIVTTRGME